MNTPNHENDSGSGHKPPEKWLEQIATLQADNRTLQAQMSVARGLIVSVNDTASRWDSDGRPCWCNAADVGHGAPIMHISACYELRRLLRGLMLELVSNEVLP